MQTHAASVVKIAIQIVESYDSAMLLTSTIWIVRRIAGYWTRVESPACIVESWNLGASPILISTHFPAFRPVFLLSTRFDPSPPNGCVLAKCGTLKWNAKRCVSVQFNQNVGSFSSCIHNPLLCFSSFLPTYPYPLLCSFLVSSHGWKGF